MERTEAFRTLRLDSSADGRMVETAYWTLVRQAQRRSAREEEAGPEIDRLNEAYTVLSPDPRPQARWAELRPKANTSSPVDKVADWFAEEALRTRQRWANRNPEIAVIAGAALALMLFALGAGASGVAVFVSLALIFGAIWAPWRRV